VADFVVPCRDPDCGHRTCDAYRDGYADGLADCAATHKADR
jgi:hypothetical protein